ncbi:hypothetical protein K432DRAFT_385863 [Lepidopterella palustris CBS 459.81]|uniref:Uncharacterized protein n=1 Tax=Lepidopterella palustris CBS 459.81 TaxID=1314670 RepID=A0A8E2E2A8_9PEZI|nr:hypothetical protein K432DRAFT_385863 [Lepidopterella palustris CBS 459.81]
METAVALSDEDADDNQKLRTIFYDKTQQNGEVGNWTGPHTVTVRGPFKKTTAIVMKRDQNGWVRVFRVLSETDHRHVDQYNASKGGVMIIVKIDHYCWVMGNATVKYIE